MREYLPVNPLWRTVHVQDNGRRVVVVERQLVTGRYRKRTVRLR